MAQIKFIDRRGRSVAVSQPAGNTGSYHVMVNNYYYGQIVRIAGGKWAAYPNSQDLPKAYWDKLVEWVEKNESETEGRTDLS